TQAITVTGGNLIITPYNLEQGVSALNIPANVTVTNMGFQLSQPLNVSLTAQSSSTSATIAGKYEFVPLAIDPSNAVLAINSSGITGSAQAPALKITAGGSLVSDNNLAVLLSGSNMWINNGGSIQAGDQLVFAGTTDLKFAASGAMTAHSVNMQAN